MSEAVAVGDVVALGVARGAQDIGQVFTVISLFESKYGNGLMAEIGYGRHGPWTQHDRRTVSVRRISKAMTSQEAKGNQ